VLIYFDEKTARNVVRKLHQLLAEEGYLMLGYSETLFQLSDDLRSIHTEEAFFFQKHPSEKRVPPEVAVSLPERPLAREDILKTIGSQPYTGLRLARPKKVLTLQEQALPSEEEKLWEQAMEFFANEDFERAKNIFNKILAVEPDSAEGQVGMGLIFANQGHDEKAQQACQRARELDELLPELYLLQALLDQKNNRLKEAVKNYQRVLWLDPDYIIAYFNLGNIYLSMGRHADAQREFRNALELLDKQGDHFSLCFSGGLGRDALRHFCLEHI
jgi:chemotaxis protein methyltransferase CheR